MPDDILFNPDDILFNPDNAQPDHPQPAQQPDLGAPPQPDAAGAPFVVEHRQEELNQRGYFRPASRLVLTPALRTGGLWAALPPEDLRTLVLMLTFLTPNGWCRPTLLELSEAMRVSQGKARSRLQRLTGFEWHGQPLVSELPRPDGLAAFVPGRALVAHEEQAAPEPPASPPFRAAGREAVLAHSRARFARPRAEVEATIGDLMGWDNRADAPPVFPGDDPAVAEGKQRAYKAMTGLGMPHDQALDLLARFDLGRVERQIAWIGLRRAKSPARYLAAAIENDYEAPLPVRRREALATTAAAVFTPASERSEEQTGERGGPDARNVGGPDAEA